MCMYLYSCNHMQTIQSVSLVNQTPNFRQKGTSTLVDLNSTAVSLVSSQK